MSMRPGTAKSVCLQLLRAASSLALAVTWGCAAGGAGQGGSLFAPKGTPWTIRCLEIHGVSRAQHIEEFAQTLRRTPGIRPQDVFVGDDPDGYSRLYYGRYFCRTNPRTGKRPLPRKMREDLNLIRQLGDGSGRRYFLQAMPVRMPTPDVGDPEWVLANIPATYSLQVAVFEPTDTFWKYKEAAAQYCAALREEGYEAYYHHGSACSMVTVGSFGPEAVITRPDGRTYYSEEVLALQRDGLLKYNLLNGAVYRVRSDTGKKVAVPSRLVKVPHSAKDGPR